jgi:hypothetical protein
MERTSKSPRKVTLEAFEIARQTLPAYSHRFSPRKFTPHQLFAILVLKTHQRKDCRGVVALLGDMKELVRDPGLESIPHFTTLQKASERLLRQAQVRQLLDATVEQHRKKTLARSNSPRPIRRARTPAAPANITSNAAKAARKSRNS